MVELCEKWGIKEITFTHGHTGPDYQGPKGHLNVDSNFAKYWNVPVNPYTREQTQIDKYRKGEFRFTVGGSLLTPPQLDVKPKEFVARKSKQKPKAGGGRKETLPAQTGRGRTIAETWVGTAGLALTTAGATGCILFLPEIIQGGLSLSSNPLALAAKCIAPLEID